ncbi:OapA family protein [Salinisphaera aquimarina]|uniref:OapA family protein n=1 Tax=Salinisphaera aquimarina TaxID=2094031 RepID=A0ABV7ENJ0_9GAMM
MGGAAWLTTGPEPMIPMTDAGDSNKPMRAESSAHYVQIDDDVAEPGRAPGQPVDARVGARHAPDAVVDSSPGKPADETPTLAEAPDSDIAPPPQDPTAGDIALSEQDSGAADIPVAPLDPDRVIDEQDGSDKAPLVASEYTPGTAELLDDDNGTGAEPRIAERQAVAAAPSVSWHEVRVRSGDTLSIAFNRNGLSYIDSLKIAHIPEHGNRFTRGLRAGDRMQVESDADGNVLALDYSIDPLHTLEVRPKGDSFTGRVVLANVEHRKAFASGKIDTSFYVDALEAGLSDNQIMKLVKIFGWDIDFALDIRPGDRFVVVYDELFRDGNKVGDGDILAASFTNDGRNVRAVRYTGEGNADTAYYSPEGRAMKKAFIRTPVDYTRISSGFNLSRKHPILNRIRRHEGTDYAAPSGTPIKATGNGRIVFRGRRGGYGNMIIIQHDTHLSTRYGHMSAFAKGYGVGSRVHQGDVIGYVGMTGLATGPHLHYEFRVDGSPKDPEKIALPKALPLPKKFMPDFKKTTAPLLAQLDTLSHTEVASLDSSTPENTN